MLPDLPLPCQIIFVLKMVSTVRCFFCFTMEANTMNLDITAPIVCNIGCHGTLADESFCHLLIMFANSWDPDKKQQSVYPDLDPNRLTQ